MFSERLRKLRKERNYSQASLAEALFVSQQAVARWETDKATPNPDTLARLVELFDISADELLGTSTKKKASITDMIDATPEVQELKKVMETLSPEDRQRVLEFGRNLASTSQTPKQQK